MKLSVILRSAATFALLGGLGVAGLYQLDKAQRQEFRDAECMELSKALDDANYDIETGLLFGNPRKVADGVAAGREPAHRIENFSSCRLASHTPRYLAKTAVEKYEQLTERVYEMF